MTEHSSTCCVHELRIGCTCGAQYGSDTPPPHQPETGTTDRRVEPADLKVGDRFVPTSGPWAHRHVEVVSVEEPHHGVYRFRARLLDPIEVGIDYSESVVVLATLDQAAPPPDLKLLERVERYIQKPRYGPKRLFLLIDVQKAIQEAHDA